MVRVAIIQFCLPFSGSFGAFGEEVNALMDIIYLKGLKQQPGSQHSMCSKSGCYTREQVESWPFLAHPTYGRGG